MQNGRLRTIQLHTHRIKISYRKRLRGSLLGDAQPNIAKITIATHDPISGEKIPEELIQHALGHELAHYIFKLAAPSRTDLYEDEDLVDLVGGMIASMLFPTPGQW